MKTVLIFGGSGFVGGHIIRRIAKNGHKIIIPHQNQVNESKLRLLGTTGQIIPIKFREIKEQRILSLIDQADVIINLKTLWDEKKTTYKKGIYDFNCNLISRINKMKRNPQFIYFSGLGIDEVMDSDRSSSIYKSEKHIQKYLKRSVIVRPGIIIGGEDQFLKGLLPLFKISFFIPLFGKGLSKFQPVFIDDVSIAISKIIETNLLDKNLFEFVGPKVFNYREFYNLISKFMKKTRVLVPIPFKIAKIAVSILEKTPISPLNSEQLKLFEKDNLATNKYKNLRDIGVIPQDLTEIIKKIVTKSI